MRLTHWIDGEAREAASGRWRDVFDPATAKAFAQVADGDAQDVEAAVAAAEHAFPAWSTMPNSERALYVTQVANAPDPYTALASRLKHVPIWIFHGSKDDVVPPNDDRKTFAALKSMGADVQYTEFPDESHNSWDATYHHDAMWTWLFAQRRD